MRCRPVFVGIVLMLKITSAYAAPGAHGPNGEHLDTATTNTTTSGLGRLPDGSVNVPKIAQRRMEIRTIMPVRSETAKTVKLNGIVAIDPATGGVLQAPFDGKLQKPKNGFAQLGQKVYAKQVLAQILPLSDGLSMSERQLKLTEMETQLKMAENRFKRLQQLSGSIPEKDIQNAKLDIDSLSKQKNTLIRMINSGQSLTAAVDGVVTRAEVLNGQIVPKGQILYEIINPYKMLIQAQTPNQLLIDGMNSATLENHRNLKLKFIGQGKSLINGQVPVQFLAMSSKENQPLDLILGQPVTVILQLKERINGFVLPASALSKNTNNEPVVWIKMGAERFIAQPVQYQSLNAHQIVITKGLGAENRVITQGAGLVSQIR